MWSFTALGPAADGFVLAGAQAMKFASPQARATRDFDFVLDVVLLRHRTPGLAGTLRRLGYEPVEGARYFQFQKPIPGSTNVMRIEFMAPERYKRRKDFRVDIEEKIHARACTGGAIAVVESDPHEISVHRPDGTRAVASLRVTRPHSLVMRKCLAMDERYRNVSGRAQLEHDRDEARIHAADIIAILRAQANLEIFRSKFQSQFTPEPGLRPRVNQILRDYFGSDIAPGFLLYEEFLTANMPEEGPGERRYLDSEIQDARKMFDVLIRAD